MPCILGHALSMTALPGGKAKHDRLDADTIALLRRGGMLPQASVYPAEMRATRDRLRRRMPLRRQRAALLTPSQTTHRQDHRPTLGKNIADKANRRGVAERFPEPAVQKRIAVARAWIAHDDHRLSDVARSSVPMATHHEAHVFSRRRAIPGVGKLLALVRLDESPAIQRFPRGQAFVSSGRLVKGAKASAGKRSGSTGAQSGQASLQGAFSEAAVLCRRHHPAGQKAWARGERQQGRGKALTVFAHQRARAGYSRRRRETAFKIDQVLNPERDGAREPDAERDAQGIRRGRRC
jgi:hypothetical protein